MLERLQKIIARAGIASRRHAEQLIVSGQVRVNDRVVSELGSKADLAQDRVEVAGQRVAAVEEKVYLLLHKPAGVVSTMADPEGRKTLRNFLRGLPERVYPVGRLDYAAAGLVLLTNDGELANRMLKAAGTLPQTYWVKVKGRLENELIARIEKETGARLKPLKQPYASRGHGANFWYEGVWSDSRRDTLRRWLWAAGHRVEKIKRMGLANLNMETLQEGHYRRIEPRELVELIRSVERSAEEFKAGRPSRRRTGPAVPRKGLRAGMPDSSRRLGRGRTPVRGTGAAKGKKRI
ncbi:MAG TPA: pseudouridine synthase [Candidatus Dormibacteraeota bacterium]|nr:pseudouridine synthase [Candidatus Dormibacteraeota bacterium]